MSLKTALAEHISKHGPMPVGEYMRRCAEHYYATRDPFGAQGDFITSPEISQIFGEIIGAWLADTWSRLGEPDATLCELGPGRGTLMKDALRATAHVTGFHDAVDILLAESSPTLRALQQQALKNAHPRIRWQEEVDTFPRRPLLLIANEFFDALPIEQYVRVTGGQQQRRVNWQGEALSWQPEGDVVREASPTSTAIVSRVAGHIHTHGGAALIIDYGYDAGAQADTLQAVRHHAFADPLGDPGEADITAHVDFAALRHAAKAKGASSFGPVEQGTFLTRQGAELRASALCKTAAPDVQQSLLSGLERLTAPHQMGALFKVLAITSSLDTPAGF